MPMEKGTEFTVELERTENMKYGWEVEFTPDDSGIQVLNVVEGGVIDTWNKEHADAALTIGDVIKAVNGLKGKEMSKHLGRQAAKETGPITFTCVKGDPDDLAKGMELKDLAKGFQMSTIMPVIMFNFQGRVEAIVAEHPLLVPVLFVLVFTLRVIVLILEYFQAQKVPTEGLIEFPEVKLMGVALKPAKKFTPLEYEMDQVKTEAGEIICGGIVAAAMMYYYETPLLISIWVVRTVFKFFESHFFMVTILGKTVKRPYETQKITNKKKD